MARPADFFVSYTSADQAWAEWISRHVEAEGYEGGCPGVRGT